MDAAQEPDTSHDQVKQLGQEHALLREEFKDVVQYSLQLIANVARLDQSEDLEKHKRVVPAIVQSYLSHLGIGCGIPQAHLVEEDGYVGEEVEHEDAFEVAGEDLRKIALIVGVHQDVLLLKILACKYPHLGLRVDLLPLYLNVLLLHGGQALDAHVDDDQPGQRPLEAIQVWVVHKNIEVE